MRVTASIAGVSHYIQIKLDIVPDKGWQSEDMFVPAGYHMDTSISDEEGSPPENDQPSFSYPAGLGSVLMNGCFGTGYKEGDPCYVAKWKMDACLVRIVHGFFNNRLSGLKLNYSIL